MKDFANMKYSHLKTLTYHNDPFLFKIMGIVMGSHLFRSDVHVNAISMPCTMHAGAVIGLCSLGTITDPLVTCI